MSLKNKIGDWLFDKLFIGREARMLEPLEPVIKTYVRRTNLKPLNITGKQIHLHNPTLERLEYLRASAVQICERIEAMGNEACELMGFDPESDDCCAEIAKDIVFNCDTPSDCIEHIADIMRMRDNARKVAEDQER